MARYVMTARRKAALRRAQLASARKRRKGKRIDRRIHKIKRKNIKQTTKAANIIAQHTYTHREHGGIYMTRKGVKTYNKAVRKHNLNVARTSRLKAKKRKLR